MDKYLIVVLMFLIAGMGIAITRDPPNQFHNIATFYSMLAGAIIVIVYSATKNRKQQNSRPKKDKK